MTSLVFLVFVTPNWDWRVAHKPEGRREGLYNSNAIFISFYSWIINHLNVLAPIPFFISTVSSLCLSCHLPPLWYSEI